MTLVAYDGKALGILIREIEALPEYRIDNKPLIRIHDSLCQLHYGWVADLVKVCPFDGQNDLEPTDPCPICGDLGTFDAEDSGLCVSDPFRKVTV